MADLHTKNYWVTDHNFWPEVRQQLTLPQQVEIYDLTLREIDQTPGAVLRYEEKMAMAREMDKLGVDKLEIFPVVSKEDARALKDIGKKGYRFKTSALARYMLSDIDAAAACDVYEVQIEGPASPALQELFDVSDPDVMIKQFVDAVVYAKKLGLYVSSVPWDMGKVDIDVMERLYKSLAEAGTDEIIYADTFGFSTPWTTTYTIRKMREWVGPNIKLGCHFHNDYGLATANSLAAVAGGASVVHCAINGIGERAGNTALDEFVLGAELLLGVKTNINMGEIYNISKKLAEIAKMPIPGNKPITGDRNFQMGSGLLVDWLDKLGTPEREVAILPFGGSLIGRAEWEPVYGKGVGANMVAGMLEKKGYTPTREQVAQIRDRIKEESLLLKALVTEHAIDAIIEEVMG